MAEQAHSATTEAHHAPPTDNIIGLDPSGWVAMSMVAVFAIMLWKRVPAMIAAALDKKIAGIRENLDAAAKLRAEAEALKTEYEIRARDVSLEADALKTQAEEEAKLIVAKAKSDATALIARRAKAAEDKIAAAERAAIADVRARAAQVAASAAAQLIAANHDAASDKALVDQSIAGLGRLN